MPPFTGAYECDGVSSLCALTRPQIATVIAEDMCIACGACIHTCPARAIVPHFDAYRGAHEVRIARPDQCAECAAPCDAVCPSIEIDLCGLLDRMQVERTGQVRGVYVGFARAHQDNGRSSSGGLIRAFIEDSLRAGRPVICLASVGDDYEPDVLRTVDDLARVPGSIYHSVSLTRTLGLLRELDRPCTLVAIPCQLEGARAYIRRVEPELEARIALTVGLICGWMYSHHGLRAFLRYKGIAGDVEDAQYRGEDKVGLLKVKAGGVLYKYNRRQFGSLAEYVDYRASFAAPVNRMRCRVCEDHVNVLADVAVGDAWLDRKRGQKLSIAIVRTERGERAMSDMRARGAIDVEDGATADIDESQSRDLVQGQTARRVGSYLRGRGMHAPRFLFSQSGDSAPAPSASDQRRFGLELRLRDLLRRGAYRRYRLAYFLGNLNRSVRGYVSARVDALRGKTP